jgi:CDP-glucose 4,6-dehydratase
VYGGGDLNVSRLIPDVVLSILAGRAPVLRSDGNHARDFLYASDAVEAYLLLGENVLRPEVAGEAFNFGTGHAYRVRDVVDQIIVRLERPDLQPLVENRVKPGEEIQSQYLDSAKAQRVLGWQPTTPLPEGLDRTIDWYRRFWTQTVELSAGYSTAPLARLGSS